MTLSGFPLPVAIFVIGEFFIQLAKKNSFREKKLYKSIKNYTMCKNKSNNGEKK